MAGMDFFIGALKLMRPLEWSKSFGNMAIGTIFAAYATGIAADPSMFIGAFIAVSLLWSGLYTLNDWTDKEVDRLHNIKRNRPIPSGVVGADFALFFSAILIAMSFAIGYFINALFMVCLAGMLINQMLYTLEPFSFKKRPVVDLISGSAINPIFRFYAGWVLVAGAFNAPLLALIFVVGIQFGGFTIYRMSSYSVEKSLGYRSSVVVFGEGAVKAVSYISIAASIIAYFAMTLNGNFIDIGRASGWLPFKFFLLGALSMIALPLYAGALMNPKSADIGKMYNIVYINYIVFIAGMIILFFLP